MNLTWLWPIIILLSPLACFSQYFTIDTIRGQSPYNKDISYIFPHLKGNNNSQAADLINEEMMKDELDIDSGRFNQSIFENVWGNDNESTPTLSDISYWVINNNDHFFSIGVSATGFGAYPQYGTRYYTFDSRTGKKILLRELFSKQGLTLLWDSVITLRNSRIYAQVANLKIELDSSKFLDGYPLSADDEEYILSAIKMYPECGSRVYKPDDDLFEDVDYSVDRKQLVVYLESCLPHFIQSLDEVDYSLIFDFRGIKNYLNDYGKSLLEP